MSRPAERVVPWFEYRNIFLTEERIAAGVRFWTEHAETLEQIAERYGVAPEMIVAIVGIETYFGTRMGRYRVLDALATLAFAYPPRAAFFTSELESFLLLTREEEVDPTAALGLVRRRDGRGAVHSVELSRLRRRRQMPTASAIFGATGTTCFGSVANYFAKHGWRAGEPVMQPAIRPERFAGRSRAIASSSAAPSARWPDGLCVHDDVAVRCARRGVFVRGRRRRLGVLGRLPQLSRRHALQPQHEVRARGASVERGDSQPLRRDRRQQQRERRRGDGCRGTRDGADVRGSADDRVVDRLCRQRAGNAPRSQRATSRAAPGREPARYREPSAPRAQRPRQPSVLRRARQALSRAADERGLRRSAASLRGTGAISTASRPRAARPTTCMR